MKRVLILSALLTMVMATVTAADAPRFPPSLHGLRDVEISPGVFLQIDRWDWVADDPANNTKDKDEWTRFQARYRNIDIAWEGVEIPVVLREHNDTLYLVGFRRTVDRQNLADLHHSYFVLQAGKFLPVEIKAFPKSIATQNMWVSPEQREGVLSLDIDSRGFQQSAMPILWHELLKGERPRSTVVDLAVLAQFLKEARPIRLHHIHRPPESPVTRPAEDKAK